MNKNNTMRLILFHIKDFLSTLMWLEVSVMETKSSILTEKTNCISETELENEF